ARFSADAKHIAYIIQPPAGHTAMIDDKAAGHFDQIFALHPSPTGHSFAFVAMRDGKSLILVDDRETQQYDAILGRQAPVFLENGSIRFLALREGQITQVTTTP